MSHVWQINQTRQARKDREDIIRWTVQQFGTRQAVIYTETIALALEALGSGPHTPGTKQQTELGPNIYTLHIARNGRKGRHFIVFRVSGENVIDVLRILHDRMDLLTHLV